MENQQKQRKTKENQENHQGPWPRGGVDLFGVYSFPLVFWGTLSYIPTAEAPGYSGGEKSLSP